MADLTDDELRDIADPWHPIDEVGGSMRVLASLLAREVLELRHPARIETDAELQAVVPGTVVRGRDGTIAARFNEVHGVVFGDDRPFLWTVLRAPAEILYDPTPKAARS